MLRSSRPPSGTLARTPIIPNPLVAASDTQRRKVARSVCAVCRRRPCDPAHLVPQRLGGCADPDCVIALCRTHHRLYDAGELHLAAYLGTGHASERRHALTHVSAWALCRALAGGGWPDAPSSAASHRQINSPDGSSQSRSRR